LWQKKEQTMKNHRKLAKSRSMDPLANSTPLGPKAVTTSLNSSASHRGGASRRRRRPKAKSSSGDSTEGTSWERGRDQPLGTRLDAWEGPLEGDETWENPLTLVKQE